MNRRPTERKSEACISLYCDTYALAIGNSAQCSWLLCLQDEFFGRLRSPRISDRFPSKVRAQRTRTSEELFAIAELRARQCVLRQKVSRCRELPSLAATDFHRSPEFGVHILGKVSSTPA